MVDQVRKVIRKIGLKTLGIHVWGNVGMVFPQLWLVDILYGLSVLLG